MLLAADWQRLQSTCTAAVRPLSTLAERIGRDLLQAQPLDRGDAARHKVCHVGLIGFPNAGKSQLTNQLTGVKVTAVSPKAHTTRAPQLGAFTVEDTQVVLHDTPGFADASAFGTGTPGRLQRVKSAWQTAQQCDVLLFIVDAEAQVRHLHGYGTLTTSNGGLHARCLCPP
jgi:ribosome-interacting GTPase 1